MSNLKSSKYILVSFFCIIGYYHAFAQTTEKLSKIEIDSILISKLNNQNKRDTLFSLAGQTKFYKRILGFIRIKTGEGVTLDYTVFVNNKLFMYCKYSKKFKKGKIEEFDYEYYFFKNRLVKYEATRELKRKSKAEWEEKHKIDLYFNGRAVIGKILKINDNYNYSKINLKWIFQEATRIESEASKIKPH